MRVRLYLHHLVGVTLAVFLLINAAGKKQKLFQVLRQQRKCVTRRRKIIRKAHFGVEAISCFKVFYYRWM